MKNTTSTCESYEEKELTLDGFVQAQERPIFTTRGGSARAVDPKKSRAYKTYVGFMARKIFKKPFEKDVEIEITVYKKIPKSWSKKKTQDAWLGKVRPLTKPDVDNYVKSILDGLSKIAYKDDRQVTDLVVRKRYGLERAEVVIRGKKGSS